MDQYENGSTDIVQSIIDEKKKQTQKKVLKNLILTFFTVGAIGLYY